MTQTKTPSLVVKPYSNPQHEAEQVEQDRVTTETNDQVDASTTQPEPVHNWEKRYKDLQSYSQKTNNELKAQLTEAQQQNVAPLTVPKTADELAAWKARNAEAYSVIETMASQMTQQQLAQYDANLANINSDLMETKMEKAELAVRAAHPDFDAIVASDDFHAWAGVQTAEIQNWIYENPDKPEYAIQALSLYKYEKGSSQQNNPNQPAQMGDMNVNVRTQSQTPDQLDRNHPAYVWKESEMDPRNMRPDEFAKWEEHITLAQREGRILYGQ